MENEHALKYILCSHLVLGIWTLAQPLVSSVTLSNLLKLPEPWVLPVFNGLIKDLPHRVWGRKKQRIHTNNNS